MRHRVSSWLGFRRNMANRTGRPVGGRLVPRVEALESREVLNAAWGLDGPPLIGPTGVVAQAVSLVNGDASGAGAITWSDVDYYRFTPGATGFYRLSVTGSLDAVVGV